MRISERIYDQNKVITFSNTKSKFGGLSNMAPGFSLFVNEVNIPNSEALYQACRFPLFPDIQEEIISKRSPMDSKKVSRKYIRYTRQDWDLIKFDVMRWCLEVKLIQNIESFGELLSSTKDKPIVEFSKNDKVWAACPINNGKQLVGKNALGRLLMELRDNLINEKLDKSVSPLNISAFLLYNKSIDKVYSSEYMLVDFNLDSNNLVFY